MLPTQTPVPEGHEWFMEQQDNTPSTQKRRWQFHVGVLVLIGAAATVSYVSMGVMHGAVGGPDLRASAMEDHARESEILRMRVKQAVLGRREEILRYQLLQLESQYQRLEHQGNTAVLEQLRKARNDLVLLLRDQRQTEDRIVDFLRELWDAQGRARMASMSGKQKGQILLSWPIEPHKGISAYFHDVEYEARFGLVHEAIDIPILHGSPIHAAADGIVEAVADNGMGYNYLIIRHDGFATLYGHVASFLVQEGDAVREGQEIALSGGTPGTPGAGAISTGAHVHFELIVNGKKVDPLLYLPYRRGISDE